MSEFNHKPPGPDQNGQPPKCTQPPKPKIPLLPLPPAKLKLRDDFKRTYKRPEIEDKLFKRWKATELDAKTVEKINDSYRRHVREYLIKKRQAKKEMWNKIDEEYIREVIKKERNDETEEIDEDIELEKLLEDMDEKNFDCGELDKQKSLK